MLMIGRIEVLSLLWAFTVKFFNFAVCLKLLNVRRKRTLQNVLLEQRKSTLLQIVVTFLEVP